MWAIRVIRSHQLPTSDVRVATQSFPVQEGHAQAKACLWVRFEATPSLLAGEPVQRLRLPRVQEYRVLTSLRAR